MNKMTLNQAIELIATGSNQIGETFYKSSDIITLLEHIETGEAQSADPLKDEQFMSRLKAELVQQFDEQLDNADSEELVQYDSAEFRLSGNEIILDEVRVNTYDIVDNFRRAFDTAIENLREEAGNE